MIILSHPTGNTFSRAILVAFEDARLLMAFHTSLATGVGMSGHILSTLVPGQAARRGYAVPPERIRAHPWREVARFIAPKLGLPSLTRHEIGWACVDAVYHAVDRGAARAVRRAGSELRAVYAYEDGGLETFRAAKDRGVTCFYDLPIAYWRLGRSIHEEEAGLHPDWAMTLSGLSDSPAKLARKDEELALADVVFCASTFTRDSLRLFPGGLKAPVHVVPYGAPCAEGAGDRGQAVSLLTCPVSPVPSSPVSCSPLKLLFVGGLSQRKGLSYLFEAVDRLGGAVELTVVGRRPAEPCAALDRELRKHRHIESLPHAGVLAEMERADVFVFPSLFEGFGLVLLEAMSRGVPCITTPHTAGPDFMTDGVDGYIVPIRDVDAIVEKVLHLHDDRDALSAMKAAARATAERQTWEKCKAGMVAAIRETLGI